MTKQIAKVWTFESSTSSATYEAILYRDGTTSCACPGWCRRVASNGSRSCKHTRLIDMGRADQECLSGCDYRRQIPSFYEIVHPYEEYVEPPKPKPQSKAAKAKKQPTTPAPGYVVKRKFAL